MVGTKFAFCQSGIPGSEHERRTEAESEPILSIYLPTTYPLPLIGAGLLQRSFELCYINLELRRRSPQLCKNHISEFSGPDLKAEKDGAVQV